MNSYRSTSQIGELTIAYMVVFVALNYCSLKTQNSREVITYIAFSFIAELPE